MEVSVAGNVSDCMYPTFLKYLQLDVFLLMTFNKKGMYDEEITDNETTKVNLRTLFEKSVSTSLCTGIFGGYMKVFLLFLNPSDM